LLALVTLYCVSGMVIVPAWSAWMGALTEHVDRERYFARRSGFIAAALLVAFLWGGYHLHDGQASRQLSHAYAWLFGVGLVARTASSVILMLQPDPSLPPRDSLLRVLARTRTSLRGSGMKLALGLSLFMFGAHMSIPFYAPFMLKTLDLGYDGFALLVAVQLICKSLVLPVSHHIAARLGLGRLLALSLLIVSAVAYAWGAAHHIYGLIAAQILSGIGWALYEFASFQLLLRAVRPTLGLMALRLLREFDWRCRCLGSAADGEHNRRTVLCHEFCGARMPCVCNRERQRVPIETVNALCPESDNLEMRRSGGGVDGEA
jgi:Na+/melibiose symporter-like transporter